MFVVKGPNATGKVFGFRVNKDTQFEAGADPIHVHEKDVALIQCYLESGHLQVSDPTKSETKKVSKNDSQKPDNK